MKFETIYQQLNFLIFWVKTQNIIINKDKFIFFILIWFKIKVDFGSPPLILFVFSFT